MTAAVAPKARRKRGAPRNPPLTGGGDDQDCRETPASVFDPLHAEHAFTIDAAANRDNAKVPRFWDRQTDGLAQSWRGEVVWCNPPYSDIAAWVAKAIFAVRIDGCRKAVLLLPSNRCEQAWWQDLIEPVRDRGLGVTTTFLRGRPKFASRAGYEVASPPFGCVVVVIEPVKVA